MIRHIVCWKLTATDAAGNAAQCAFNVIVQHREESSSGCGCQSDGGGAGAALAGAAPGRIPCNARRTGAACLWSDAGYTRSPVHYL